jgi:hypothetical protein
MASYSRKPQYHIREAEEKGIYQTAIYKPAQLLSSGLMVSIITFLLIVII